MVISQPSKCPIETLSTTFSSEVETNKQNRRNTLNTEINAAGVTVKAAQTELKRAQERNK